MGEFLNLEAALDGVVDRDPRYHRAAYIFVQRALHYYRERHGGHGEAGHLKGAELLQGVRELALAEFGPLSRNVLNNWGLLRGEDVGEIVYNLIDAGLMTKTEEDRKEDFGGIMDFGESLDAEATW
jgi:uncharacterized repeat protein (TIGR04138 family)